MYLIPWIAFSVINYLSAPIVGEILKDFFEYSVMIENVLAGVFAVIFGFIGDHIGRKRLVISGFMLLGLGYASLGLFQGDISSGFLSFSAYFYTVVDGIAWGMFYAIFLMTIWGDIAQQKSSEKYYALGYLPFLFSIFTELSIGTIISDAVGQTAVFSFASLFLFMAVLPLAYAPEPLAKNIKDRELYDYIKKARNARSALDPES